MSVPLVNAYTLASGGPYCDCGYKKKTGGRHKITLQTGKQGHEQIRRDLRAGEKENDMLYSEKNESHGQGRLPPVFQKTKGVSDMDRVKKNFGFGCMWLPMQNGEIDLAETSRMVDAFLDAGFNYFDTAHGYLQGKS